MQYETFWSTSVESKRESVNIQINKWKIFGYVVLTWLVLSTLARILVEIAPYPDPSYFTIIDSQSVVWSLMSLFMGIYLVAKLKKWIELAWAVVALLICLLPVVGMFFGIGYFARAYVKLEKERLAALETVEQMEVRKGSYPNFGTELGEGEKLCSSCEEVIAGMKLASIGARFVSYIADNLILVVFRIVINSILYFILPEYSYEPIAFTTTNLLFFIIDMSYFIYFFGKGQTIGMMMAKIKLCRTDGTYPIGYKKGAIRWIGVGISFSVLCLGFLWILIDKNRQGWHDKMAGTYVVAEQS